MRKELDDSRGAKALFRAALMVGVAFGGLASGAGPALAQEVQQQSSDDQLESDGSRADCKDVANSNQADCGKASQDEIVVTGTNIQGVKPVGSPSIVLDRDTLLNSGQSSPADVINKLPQVRNLGDFHEGGTIDGQLNKQQGTAINLRGLGVGATLLLVDGRRVNATGSATTFQEANRVPFAAIERIEVIPDGASAIYGSDAVAGVVNYVLRKDYDGLELQGRVDNNNGGTGYTLDATAGRNWSLGGHPGNILVTYEFEHRNPYLEGSNKLLRQDLSPLGGPDRRINGNTASADSPGNIVVALPSGQTNPDIPRALGYIYYGLPSGSNENLTPGDLAYNQPNLIDTSDFSDYTGRLTRHQVSAYLNQEIADGFSIFVQGNYLNRKTNSRTAGFGNPVTVTLRPYLYSGPPDADYTAWTLGNPTTGTPNPYYIAGIPGVAAGAPLTVQYNNYKSLTSYWNASVEAYSISGGFDANLPAGWHANGYYTVGRDKSCDYCILGTAFNGQAFQYAVDTGAINPLSSEPLTAAQLAPLLGSNFQRGQNKMDDAELKFDGPLFALPGGMVKVAIGGEWSKLSNANTNAANRGADNVLSVDTDLAKSVDTRTIKSAFAEVYVPVISPAMNVPLMQELSLSIAGRYDSYSDVGDTFNPKIGATWTVSDALSFRGSWGRSFRAPSLPEVNAAAQSSVFVPGFGPVFSQDPRVGLGLVQYGIINGGNPDLKPEKANTWSVGADVKPANGLHMSLTYYHINYTDRINNNVLGNLFSAFAAGNYPDYDGYGALIIPIHNPSNCDPNNSATWDPVLASFLSTHRLYGGVTNACAAQVFFDGRNINLASTLQTGLDASIDLQQPLGGGVFVAQGSLNHIFQEKEQVTASLPSVEVDRYDTPLRWRGTASVGYNIGGFTSLLTMNYVGAFTNDVAVDNNGNNLPPQRVSPWTTFDLSLGYRTDFGHAFVKDVRFNFFIQNLFDKDPPLSLTANGIFNASYANPYGRTFSASATVAF